MGLRVNFEIEDHILVLAVLAGLVGWATGLFDGLADYFRNRDSILAIHGTLIAGSIAILAARMTVGAINRQISSERFIKAVDDYNRAYGRTKTIADHTIAYVEWHENMVAIFEASPNRNEREIVVDRIVLGDRPDVPVQLADPGFWSDLPSSDVIAIQKLKYAIQDVADCKDINMSLYKDGAGIRVCSINPHDLESLKDILYPKLSSCRTLVSDLRCYKPMPVE